MEEPTDLYQDMEKLNALYGELCWDHDEQLDFTADYKNDRIIIRRKRSSRTCLLYTSPSPRDRQKSRMPSSA